MDSKQRYKAQAPKKPGPPSARSVRVSGGRGEKGEEERLGSDLDEQERPKLGGLLISYQLSRTSEKRSIVVLGQGR